MSAGQGSAPARSCADSGRGEDSADAARCSCPARCKARRSSHWPAGRPSIRCRPCRRPAAADQVTRLPVNANVTALSRAAAVRAALATTTGRWTPRPQRSTLHAARGWPGRANASTRGSAAMFIIIRARTGSRGPSRPAWSSILNRGRACNRSLRRFPPARRRTSAHRPQRPRVLVAVTASGGPDRLCGMHQ